MDSEKDVERSLSSEDKTRPNEIPVESEKDIERSLSSEDKTPPNETPVSESKAPNDVSDASKNIADGMADEKAAPPSKAGGEASPRPVHGIKWM